MKFVNELVPTTFAYSASNPATPLLLGSRSYWITALQLGTELAKTGAATTATQDYMSRIATNMTLRGGGRPYLSTGAPDLRPLYWATRLRQNGSYRQPNMITGTVTLYHMMPLSFGVFPTKPNGKPNWFDTSAAIQPDQDLTLGFTWAATTAIASATNTIATTTVMRVSVAGVVLEPGDAAIKYYPAWWGQQFIPPSTAAGFGYLMKLSTGYWYRRTTAMINVGTGTADVRTNGYATAAISQIAVQTKDGRRPLALQTWDHSHLSQRGFQVADDNADSTTLVESIASTAATYNPGVLEFDWVSLANTNDPSKADASFGLNMIGKSDGTISLAATVDTATNVTVNLFHESYLSYVA